MLAVAALAMSSGRVVAPSRTLCLALAVVLLIDPWAVLAAGFWLSFGAVGALLYVGSALVGAPGGWRERLRAWGVVQWAATLASLPVLLLVFQQFSLVSPLANAVAIPVVSFVVTPLALLAAVVPWWPIAALAHAVLGWLMLFLEWCSAWPVWQAPAPPLWAAVAAAAGVAVCLLPRGVPGRLLGVALLVPAVFWPAPRPAEGEAWVTVLDVGQGLAAVVQTRTHALVYDPGPLYSAESDAGQRVVVPYLRALGVDTVDMLMVTHRDSDHAGGTASVQAALAVGELRSSLPEIGGERCLAGQRWDWDGVSFEVLHPAPEDYALDGKSNHVSCVLRVSAGGRRLLLTSDIEARDEAALLARYPGDLAADVLLVPHHGSRTSSTPEFLAAVGAGEAVIPVGYRNRFGHPKGDVVDRYLATGARLVADRSRRRRDGPPGGRGRRDHGLAHRAAALLARQVIHFDRRRRHALYTTFRPMRQPVRPAPDGLHRVGRPRQPQGSRLRAWPDPQRARFRRAGRGDGGPLPGDLSGRRRARPQQPAARSVRLRHRAVRRRHGDADRAPRRR